MTQAERVSATALRRPSLALIALGVNLAMTLPLALVLNLWQDEAYTLHTTSAGVAYAFTHAISFEQSAPLYFVLLTLWRHFGDSLFFLRLFSVLCIAGSVALVPSLARRYVPKANPVLVTAVVVCNPVVVWAAVEMRPYALIVFLSALLLLTYHQAFAGQRPRAGSTVAYAACVILALYTQYYMAFLIAGQAVTTLFFYRRSLLRFVLAGAAGLVAFAPLIAIVPGQVQNFKDGFAPPSLAHSFVSVSGVLLRYVLPLPFPHAKLIYAVLFFLIAIAIVILRPRFTSSVNGSILVTTACAFILFAVGTYVVGVHVLNRHVASLFLPATLSVFAALSFLRSPSRERAAAVWSGVAIVLSLTVLVQAYGALAKAGDWVRVTAYVRAHETPGEPIAIFEAENALPFEYYYDGPNRVVAVPRAVDFRRYQVAQFVIRSQAQLQTVIPPAPRLWLITAGECTSSNVQFGCATLERFVSQRYAVKSDATFYGSRVRLLERRNSSSAGH
ncbi:MAG: glycosyltransferase family 39 protein [Candidatus Cybelea sp.]